MAHADYSMSLGKKQGGYNMAFNPNEHMISLKGKDYLQVAWRLVWFREDHPDWCINAECVEQDQDHAIFKAVICDESGLQKSSGHGSESKRDFGDFLEKAETKAVGRALAMLGYGTQFAADELDEGERIVDSPIKRTPSAAPKLTEDELQKLQQNCKYVYGEAWAVKLAEMMEKYGVNSIEDITVPMGEAMKVQMKTDMKAKKGAA